MSKSEENNLTRAKRWARPFVRLQTLVICIFAFAVTATSAGSLFSPPVITSEPLDKAIALGQSVSLNVTATGTGPLLYQWHLNGLPLLGQIGPSLPLGGLLAALTGGYYVTVANAFGTVTSRVAAVLVLIPPSILQQPLSQAAQQGENVTMSVLALGSSPTYQWKFNGAPIPGATNSTLTLPNVQGAQAGSYSVDVENALARITSSAVTLAIEVPPLILLQPGDQVIQERENTSFNATALGSAPLLYQWYFNETPISGANQATLSITDARENESGRYYVTVSNGAGTETSRVATLQVLVAPVITQQPMARTILQGEDALFSVTATGTELGYQWKRNGNALAGETNSTLELTNVRGSQAGNYTVEVENAAARVTSASAALTVQVPPTITQDLLDGTLLAGVAQILSVNAIGSAPMTYYWYFNGTLKSVTAVNTLTLALADLLDEGQYFVAVSNMAGIAVSRVASLTVESKPIVLVQPLPAIALKGGSATMAVIAAGKPQPTIQWEHDGTPISGGGSGFLTITNAQKSHAGKYRARLQNEYDTVETVEATLTVLDPVSILSQPKNVFAIATSSNTPAESSSALFSVDATGDLLSFQWYRKTNGGPAELLPGATLPTLALMGVTVADAGLYWVEISTPLGTVPSLAAELTVLGIKVQPTDVLAAVGETITLNVGADGQDLHYQWTRNGEYVEGATGPTLTITNAQPKDGGLYSVLVFNAEAAIKSAEALVSIVVPPLPFADNFEQRGMITGLVGVGSGNSAAATRQPNEPKISGKDFNDSVWVSWTAPASGIVTMSTLGSAFDSVLAAYQGGALDQLSQVESDDESGGFHSSRVVFNAMAGATYQIRVDSYRPDEGGNIVFSWTLIPTVCLLPLEITSAGDFAVRPGDPLNLFVSFISVSECGLNLQWHLDGRPLQGETNAWLTIPAVSEENVGTYSLRMSTQGAEYWAKPSEVQINTEGVTALARNRLEDALLTPLLGILFTDTRSAMVKSFTPLSSGYSGSQVFRTYPGKDPSEPNACGVQGGASYWFSYTPPESGTLRLSTDGSNFDTVLGVYIDDGRHLGYQSLIPVACDNNSGSNGLTSTVTFPVTQGTTYYFMVDGVNGVCGRVNLSYQLDTLPKISSIAGQTIPQNTATAWIPFTVNDKETAAALLSVQGACGNTGLVATNGITFSGSGSNRLVKITPNTNVFGTNLITIAVTDAMGGIRSTQFLLSVVSAPGPIVVNGTLPAGIEGVAYSAPIGISGGMAPFTFSLTSGAPAGLSLSASGLLSGTPTVAATNNLGVQVMDALGSITNKTITVVIIPPIRVTPTLSGTNAVFQMTGRPGVEYVLEVTVSLTTPVWTPIATNSSPTGVIVFPLTQPPGPTCFFRTKEQ